MAIRCQEARPATSQHPSQTTASWDLDSAAGRAYRNTATKSQATPSTPGSYSHVIQPNKRSKYQPISLCTSPNNVWFLPTHPYRTPSTSTTVRDGEHVTPKDNLRSWRNSADMFEHKDASSAFEISAPLQRQYPPEPVPIVISIHTVSITSNNIPWQTREALTISSQYGAEATDRMPVHTSTSCDTTPTQRHETTQ